MGLFDKQKIPEENKIATGELLKRGTETPNVGTQKIAPASKLEQTTQKLASDFVNSGQSAAREDALKSAQDFAKGSDVTQLPELQAIMDNIQGRGDRSLRSIGRSLKITGNDPGSSSKGRDIIGRAATDVQSSMMEAAAPFLESERQRRFAAIPLIDNIVQSQTNEKLTKLGVGERVGAQVRNLQQMVNDADYNRQMQELEYRYKIQPALLGQVIVARPPEVQQGALSQIREVAGTAASVGSALYGMGVGGSFGGNQAALAGGKV